MHSEFSRNGFCNKLCSIWCLQKGVDEEVAHLCLEEVLQFPVEVEKAFFGRQVKLQKVFEHFVLFEFIEPAGNVEMLFDQFLDDRPVPLVVLFLELSNVALVHECFELAVVVLALDLLFEPVDTFFVNLRRRQSRLLRQQKLRTLVDQVTALLLGFALVRQVIVK